jgi:phosphate/sulfate permease
MESFYLLLVIVLIVLSVSDLIVGVSIDALNSLNTVFSSRSIPTWIILGAAGSGILIGVTFSGGMLEVARNGIFRPEQFSFSELIIIFLSVIIAGVFLRNIFININLPLSTTVSIVFGLLGASFFMSVVKIKQSGVLLTDLPQYLNTSKSLAIILGIMASVAAAFILGFLIQWVLRIIFTFHYQKIIHYFGSLLGGVTLSLLTFFILNEIKEVSWMPMEIASFLHDHLPLILFVSLIGWIILFQILQLIWKRIDVSRVAIVAATFTLAFSFAGNDLASFLGVPIAGLESFKTWHTFGIFSENNFLMGFLNEPASEINILLLLSGFIIVLSMLNFREIRSFNFMSDDYPKPGEGTEKQGFFPVSTSIIRGSIMMSSRFGKYISPGIKNWINNRFIQSDSDIQASEVPSNDKLRMLNILIISSSLVYTGIIFKLPLSTAYITFMAALGISLADRKWNKESAVYKVSGIISLIGSWFFNAVIAFILAAVIALLILAVGKIMALILGTMAFIGIIRNRAIRRKRVIITQETEEFPEPTVKAESVLVKTNQDTSNAIIMISKAYFLGFSSFHSENKEQLSEIDAEIEEFNQRMRKLKANIFKIIQKLQQDSIETGHFYVQIIDYLREMAHSIKFVVRPLYEHLGNNHKPFSEEQNDELIRFSTQITDFLNFALHIIKESRFELIDELILKRQDILDLMREQERRQIRRIKKKETNSRNSVLYFTLMSESKNLLLQTVNLLKATRDFVSYTKSAF